MSASNSIITPGDIVLTPMRITVYPAGGGAGVDLGATQGGVDLMIKTALSDIMVDQFGKTPVDKIVSGHTFGIKTILSEVNNKARWKEAFPHFNLVTGNGGVTLFVFNMAIGDSLRNHAGKLVLHPLSKPDSDTSQDITVNLAACSSATDLKYGPDKQVGLAVEFIIFPDTSVVPARFMTYGDPTIGIVQAIAAAAVAGVNTGNGTITSEVAYSGVTATETITLTCLSVDATYGNVFSVTGSVSGNLGQISLAKLSGSTTTFNSPKISLVLNQGTTEFVHGDSFTIATTAANFA